MSLTNELISQFVKITKDDKKSQNETTVYGTIVVNGDQEYVQLDGSELLTPINTTAKVSNGERVTVLLKDHTAIVTGNITAPAARQTDVDDTVSNQISEFGQVVAESISAESGRIDKLVTDNLWVKDTLNAATADIDQLTTDTLEVKGKMDVAEADIGKLKTDKLDATTANITFATIDALEAVTIDVGTISGNFADFGTVVAQDFEAVNADIEDLTANKLSATDAAIQYANIDFANINMAAVQQLFSKSGIIQNLVVGDQSITGELVGVTIKGDLIEGNTIVADKLVVMGSDGLYYKLNTDGMTVEAQQTEYNSLSGSVITAKSITASKVNVQDLVAFDATIGGFKITNNSIYSGVKSSVNNSTRGIYLDNTGQIGFGDASNYIKFFLDTDGIWKLAIAANNITLSASGKTVEETIEEVKNDVTYDVEIISTNGNVFKNGQISTKLIAVVRRGATDVTSTIDANRFRWTRVSADSVGDAAWNQAHYGGTKEVNLTKDDVYVRATFNCEIL